MGINETSGLPASHGGNGSCIEGRHELTSVPEVQNDDENGMAGKVEGIC